MSTRHDGRHTALAASVIAITLAAALLYAASLHTHPRTTQPPIPTTDHGTGQTEGTR